MIIPHLYTSRYLHHTRCQVSKLRLNNEPENRRNEQPTRPDDVEGVDHDGEVVDHDEDLGDDIIVEIDISS